MKKIIKSIGLVIFLLVLIGGVVFFFFPEKVVETINYRFASKAELDNKNVNIDGYQVHYFESKNTANKETLIFLHGMGNDKTSFLQTVAQMEKRYHLVLLDLAGHGENNRQLDFDYSIAGQVSFLHSFLNELKLTDVTLIGNSMGGHITAAYAIKYPDKVKRIVLVNAAGIKLDDNEVYFGFEKKIESTEEFDEMLSRVLHNKPNFPYPIKRFMMKEINENMDFVNAALVPSIKEGNFYNLKNDISKIKANTLILWGKEDSIIRANVPKYFNDSIQKSVLKYIENTGHFPQLETPRIVAEEISVFMSEE